MYHFEDLEESTASKQNRKQLPAVTPKLRTGDFELLEEERDEDQYEVRELVAAHDDLPF